MQPKRIDELLHNRKNIAEELTRAEYARQRYYRELAKERPRIEEVRQSQKQAQLQRQNELAAKLEFEKAQSAQTTGLVFLGIVVLIVACMIATIK